MIVKIEFDPETALGRKLLAVLTADDKKPTVILADHEPPAQFKPWQWPVELERSQVATVGDVNAPHFAASR